MVRASVLVVLTMAVGTWPVAAQDAQVLRKSLLGKAPLELVAGENEWLAGPAVSFEKLKGRVVWLQFNF